MNHVCLLMRDAFDKYSAAVASCGTDFKAWPESKLCDEFAAIQISDSLAKGQLKDIGAI
jgi:hypothetical protein